MGGEKEFTAPAKSTSGNDPGKVVGNLRIHENNGEVHFHDDQNKRKVAVPVDIMYKAWDRLTEGKEKSFKYKDPSNGTQLRMKVVTNKNLPIDLQVEVRPLKSIEGLRSNDFNAFDKFIKG